MSQRIAIWAGSSLPNVGDRLLAAVTEAELSRRLPDATFRHFCPWSTAAGPAPLRVDRDGSWPGAGSFDAVVMAGGLWSGPPFRHPIMQVFCLGPAPEAFDPGVWVAWHGVGLQDDTPAPARDDWRGYLGAVRERIDHLTVRSRAAARRMDDATGVPGTAVVPDPAFALEPLEALEALSPRAVGATRAPRSGRRRRPLIGVAVGAPGVTSQLVTHLVGRDLASRGTADPALCVPPEQVMAEASAPGERAAALGFVTELGLTLIELAAFADIEFITVPNIYGDEEAGARFARAVPRARVREIRLPGVSGDGTGASTWASTWASIGASTGADELTEAFARCDLVLVSRYHSAILALRGATPFVAVDPFWSRRNGTSKLHELTAELGMAHRYWTHHDTHPAEDLLGIVERALDDDPIEAAVYRDTHARARAAFDRLAEGLRSARPRVTLGRSS
ncbi:polysaccharide pyruvyl transferase family protein [Streptosporangium sp. NPDC002721]|uniref:polysaccharide pyruvyl transferase family protein n=1 Tax=Streptosporangium sp. NPDC002721 TaxID=3366188 RepID=UPI00368A6A77